MATTMVGQSCKLLKVISSFRHIQISQLQQPYISGLRQSFWSGPIFDARSTQNANSLENFPPKPKMPANVFVTYLQRVEPDIKKIKPDAKRTDIVRQASKMWQELDPEEKSRLAIERRDLFDKYKEEMKLYNENITPEQIKAEEAEKEKKSAKKLKLVRKNLGMPRKPPGAFNCFISEKFGDRAGENVPTYFKVVSDEWVKMSEADKEKYKQKAQVLKDKYYVDMDQWEKEMISLGRFDVVRKSLLGKLSKGNKDKKKKKKVGFSVHEDGDKESR